MSHTHKRRRAERSSRKESGEEVQESEPALISVIFFFISALPERSEIPLVKKQERRENCQSIKFVEEQLDPHGVNNQSHILITKNKLTTIGVREELSVRITEVLINFQPISN